MKSFNKRKKPKHVTMGKYGTFGFIQREMKPKIYTLFVNPRREKGLPTHDVRVCIFHEYKKIK
ncbi:MAG: hypothetical protein LUF31_06045 [Fusobacterium sp.]|nr:hypothetical protein [Fusobacterium sp.]